MNCGQQVMAVQRGGRDMMKALTSTLKDVDRLTYQCAHFGDAEPWYLAARVKAFCRNFKESSCSISPNITRPSIVL